MGAVSSVSKQREREGNPEPSAVVGIRGRNVRSCSKEIRMEQQWSQKG